MIREPDPEPSAQLELVSGLELRYGLLVLLMDAPGPLSISQLVDGLARAGRRVDGHANKQVSDALRWEVAKGRVVRRGRGSYELGYIPRSTAWYVRERAAGRRRPPPRWARLQGLSE